MRADEAGGGAIASRAPAAVSVGRLVRDRGPSLEWRACGSPGGGGAPVLFVHGARMGAWCWSETWLPAVARTGRFAAAVSLRGHGDSDGRAGVRWTGLSELSDDLSLAIRAMPSPPVVVGHSLGGLLAQHLLRDVAAGRIGMRGLVLAGSLPPEGLALIGPWLGLSAWAAAALSAWGGTGPGRTPGLAEATFEGALASGVGVPADPRLGETAVTALAQAHLPQAVAPAFAVGVPALVLHGRDDRLIGTTDASRCALYHGAPCEIIAGTGHFPMLGRNAGAGAALLCRWLAGYG